MLSLLIISGRACLYARTTASKVRQAIKETEKFYNAYSGNAPFENCFLAKSFRYKYRPEQRTGGLLDGFSVAALYLFGLASIRRR